MKLNIEPTTFRRALGVIPFPSKDVYTQILTDPAIASDLKGSPAFYRTDNFGALADFEADCSQKLAFSFKSLRIRTCKQLVDYK